MIERVFVPILRAPENFLKHLIFCGIYSRHAERGANVGVLEFEFTSSDLVNESLLLPLLELSDLSFKQKKCSEHQIKVMQLYNQSCI